MDYIQIRINDPDVNRNNIVSINDKRVRVIARLRDEVRVVPIGLWDRLMLWSGRNKEPIKSFHIQTITERTDMFGSIAKQALAWLDEEDWQKAENDWLK